MQWKLSKYTELDLVMVIKNGKKMKCLFISFNYTYDYMRAMLKNHQRTRTKFINYLQGLHIIAIFENTSKHDISNYKEKNLSWRSTSANLDAVSKQLFQKKSTTVFFWSLTNFFKLDINNNSWWIAQIILSKKVKQELQ